MSRRLRHAAQGFAATLLTLVLVVGVPAGLIRYVGWPLPSAMPTLDELQLALRSGIDPQLVVNAIGVVVWLLWLQLFVSLSAEVVAVVRGHGARILPVLPGMQHAAARLVATITLVAAGLAPVKAPPALALPPDTFATVTYTPTLQSPGVNEPTVPAATTPAPDVVYTTRQHDTLWGIAERSLGDGRRWHEIRQLNPGQVTSDGAVEPGVDLVLPEDATVPAPESVEVTVETGDHFWSLSEDALAEVWGRPPTDAEIAPYWQQVVEANRERLAPPHDPSLIYPGQVFLMPNPPPDPQGKSASELAAPEPAEQESEVHVRPGDNLWSISKTALTDAWGRVPADTEISIYWSQVIAANRDRLIDGDNPSHIVPGQIFELPSIPADPTLTSADSAEAIGGLPNTEESSAEPATGSDSGLLQPETTSSQTTGPRPEPAATPAGAPADEPSQASDTRPSARLDANVEAGEDEEAGWFPTAARLAGLGVIAAGIVALVDRLRRRQLQHRQPDTIPTPPPAEAAAVEAELRAAASVDGVGFVDLALRALGRQTLDHHLPPPHLVGVHLSDEQVKVLLWTPHSHPPPGWNTEDDDTIWSLTTTTDITHLRLLADGTPAPYPTLVTAGHDPYGQLLLDLEFFGAVTVTGEPDEVIAACRTMAVELAASPLADQLKVICVGFGSDLADLERITVAETLDDALLDQLEDRASVAGSEETTLDARLGPGGDNSYPVVVIDPATSPPPGADRLLAAAQAGRSIAAVVGYPTGDRWRLRLSGGSVTVEPLGLSLSRRDLTADEQEAVAGLVAAAKDLDGQPGERLPVAVAFNGHQPAIAEDFATPLRLRLVEEQDQDLDVRVLGTIRIDRLEERFPSRKAAELPVYLALHRDGAEADTLMEALWPGEAPDYNRLNRTTSRARSTLGATLEGEPYIPPFSGGLYRVNPRLGCDLDRFTSHTRAATQTDGPDQVAHLIAALQLVEGTPFSGTGNGYVWAWEEGLVSHAIVAVDNAAHRLASLALDTGDADLAESAARKGLVSTTRCEECYRNLMRAAINQNSQTALDAVFTELTTVIDGDDGPDATAYLEPETIELYERHSRSRPQ